MIVIMNEERYSMFTMTRTRMALLLVVILLMISTGYAEDWHQFRGPNRDGRSSETGLLERWPEEGPAMLWSYTGLGRGYATVSIVDGIIYTTGMIDETGYLFAIAENGAFQWKQAYGPEWTGPYPGTRTTPAVDGDRVYIISGHGRVVCFDRSNGDIQWQTDTLEKFNGKNITWGIAECLLIDGDRVICTPGGENATIVALNKYNGETVWTTKELSALSAYCSPILCQSGPNRLLFTMVKGLFVCVNAVDGKVLWTVPHDTRNHIAAVMPVALSDNRIYFTSHETGGTVIRYSENGMKNETLWNNKALDCLHGGVVAFAPEGLGTRLYGSDSQGYWVCQDAQTGDVIFQKKILDAKGSITCADGMLYCYNENGTLGLVKPTQAGMELVSSFQIAMGDGEHWAYPVIQNGRLYIRHGDTLMAFDIKQN